MGQKTNSTTFSLSLKNAEWKSKYVEKNLEESSILLHKNIEIRNYLNRIFKLHGLIIHNCKIEYNHTTASFFVTFFEKKTETLRFYNQNSKTSQKELTSSSNYTNSKELINHLVNNILTINLNLFFKNKTVVFKVQNLNQKFELLINNSKTKLFKYKDILKQFRRFLKNPLFKELIKVLFIAVTERNSAKLVAEAISHYFTKQKKRHGFILFLLKKTLETLIPSEFSIVKGVKIVISGRFNGAQRSNKKILKINTVPLQSFDSTISYYEDTAYTSNGTFGIKVWICEKK
jgi:ribosomal protein S3|tara:strand:+ start:1579 stop:2445 length:867 start_codon:yes stop_codon:yes gene_type:complete